MISEKRFDFSEETNIKDALLLKLRRKFIYENNNAGNTNELSDEELKLVAGGQNLKCPFGGVCSTCQYNQNGVCKIP